MGNLSGTVASLGTVPSDATSDGAYKAFLLMIGLVVGYFAGAVELFEQNDAG